MLLNRKKSLAIMLSFCLVVTPLTPAFAADEFGTWGPGDNFGIPHDQRQKEIEDEKEAFKNSMGEKVGAVRSAQPSASKAEALANGGSNNAEAQASIGADTAAAQATAAEISSKIDSASGPTQPTLGSETELDQSIAAAVSGASLPNPTLESVSLDQATGKIKVNTDSTGKSLTATNKALKEAATQQKNQDSASEVRTYAVQNSSGESVMLTKNPCYQSTEEKCLSNYTYSWRDDNGEYHEIHAPLNTFEYLGDSNGKITSDMIQQAKQQELYTNATLDALNDGEYFSIDMTSTVTSAARAMIANGADPKQAAIAAIMAYQSQQENEEAIRQLRETSKYMQEIKEAKDNAMESVAEDARVRSGTGIVGGVTKRFRAEINPSIPTVNSSVDIMATLVTKSGKPNDESKYKIYAVSKNYDTGQYEKSEVLENTPFVVSYKEWTKTPGTRTVQIIYQFANSKQIEKYSFSYTIGQLSTAILPNGRAVTNSVTAMAANADTLNYNVNGQSVAGRISAAKYDQGVCYMQITDAKDNSDTKWPSVVVASGHVSESECGDALVDRYVSMDNVTAQYNSENQYIFVDNSDSDGFTLMTESEYEALEEAVAKATQESGNEWDNSVLRVSDDGTIYEGLPGELGVNFLNLSLGNDNNVNIGIAIDPDTGTYMFAKADGTPYTAEELKAKGIVDTSSIAMGADENGKVYAYNSKTGDLLSNGFSYNDASALSLITVPDTSLSGLDTSGTLTNQSVIANAGGSSMAGTIVQSFTSSFTNASKNVVSITGNIASIGSGLFASMGAASLGTTGSFSTNSDAERVALKACASVPDRCQEFMNYAKAQ